MLEGEIRDIDLVARLVELWRERFTGAIRFENDGIIKIIYFKGGDVLSASTNDRADSVDEILMRAGKVSREHVKQALAKRKENETLGDTLLTLGFITRKELTWARRVQVVGVIRSIAAWEAGSYTIVEDYLPKRDEGTNFSLPQLIVEMVVTDQDRPKFEKLLESGTAVFSKAAGFPEAFAKLGLNDEADAIVSEVDGSRTATEVAEVSGQDSFNTYRLLHALSLLGLFTRASENGASQPMAFEGVGVADAADAWVAEMPKFDLDDAPGHDTATLPPATPPEPSLAPAAQESSEWKLDEIADVAVTADRGPVEPAIPKFTPPPPVISRPVPGPSFGSLTSRPLPTGGGRIAVPRKKRHSPALLASLVTVVVVAAGGYFGLRWWSGRSSEPAPVVATRPATAQPGIHRPLHPAAGETGATSTGTAAAAGSSLALPAASSTTEGASAPASPPVSTTPSTAREAAFAPTDQPVRLAAPTASASQTTSPSVAPGQRSDAPRTGAPAEDASADRYAAMARDFAAAPSGNFTVQFEIVCQSSNIAKALREGGTNVWFVPISLKGRSCYRVFWGRYPTRQAAERGVSEIPASLREAKPAVVTVPRS